MRPASVALPLLLALASCAAPPPGSYVGRSGLASTESATALGADANGEPCRQIQLGGGDQAAIYCGAWQQPAAHVRAGGPAPADSPAGIATSSTWRSGLDLRYSCGAPEQTTILSGQPAALLRCTRKVGGWPQLALVASVDGRVWLADGILPTLPAVERSIGILSGRITADAAALPRSAADALLANELSRRAFSAGDVGAYEQAMALGARGNLAEDFATAETAYRSALAVQQKALGRANPDTVTPLMHLALQLSDQGRYHEADALFRQAEALAPRATDPAASARLLHYRALDALNQGKRDEALRLLARSEASYAALVPSEALAARAPQIQLASAQSGASVDLLPTGRVMVDPGLQSALMGVIETRRYRAILLRDMGRGAESAEVMASARAVAQANGMVMPLVAARLGRTASTTVTSGDMIAGLTKSTRDFEQVLPRTRPFAETALLQAAAYARQGSPDSALPLCAAATTVLTELRAGASADLLAPCLAAYAAAAERRAADREQLFAAMFETAQLAQSSITSRQIAEAAARLGAGGRDPRVAEAIRRQQDAAETLAGLYRARDALSQPPPPGSPPIADADRDPAALDKRIADAQADMADADSALQAAAPNYPQLVQQVVPTADVLSALGPDEAFAAIVLGREGGWTFLLRDGKVTAARLDTTTARTADLVRRLRNSVTIGDAGLPAFDGAAAQALYQSVLAPVARRLEGVKALVVAPSGPLLSVPFATLLTGPADPANLAASPWLIRRMTVAHVPAAANFVALRRAASGARAANPWFGFGAARPVTLAQAERIFPAATCGDSARLLASLPPLPYAPKELETARRIMGAAPSDVVVGAAFTKAAVLRTDLRNYRILHFATHALLPAELRCQTAPAVVTSSAAGASDVASALLDTDAVIGVKLNADSVILSACNSGGPNGTTSGDSLSGLARAFFFAGARSMLVTHWSINDQASAYLVVDTLRRYAGDSGIGLAEALAATQRGILDEAGKEIPAVLAHPFYWAPFALIGEGRQSGGRIAARDAAPTAGIVGPRG